MSKKLFIFLGVVVIGAALSGQPAAAQTSSVGDIITRMNQIIAQMDDLRQEFQALSGQVGTTAPPAGEVLGAATSDLQGLVVIGETNDTIKKVQRLLATDPEIYPYGVASGFFGPKTEAALKNLQARFGWNTPGVVGPATEALLQSYFAAYPSEQYPDGVLKTRPVSSTVTNPTTPTTPVVTNNPAQSIIASLEDGVARVTYVSREGKKESFMVRADNETQAVASIARVKGITTTEVTAVITFGRGSSSSNSGDRDDAKDAIDDAEDDIDDAEAEIDEADDDGEDVDYAEDLLDEAEDALDDAEDAYDDGDYDDAIDLAEEASELAKDAEDAIGEDEDGDDEELDEINVDITDEDEARVEVEYENGDDDSFTVDEDQRDNIIEEIADELNIDEDEVEDVIEFDYGDIADIDVQIEDGEARVTVEYETGVEERFVIDENDEDEMIEDIADIIDVDEDDVEDNVDFDYR